MFNILTKEECIKAWNEQADEYNQWDVLDVDEKIEWVIECANRRIDAVYGVFEINH